MLQYPLAGNSPPPLSTAQPLMEEVPSPEREAWALCPLILSLLPAFTLHPPRVKSCAGDRNESNPGPAGGVPARAVWALPRLSTCSLPGPVLHPKCSPQSLHSAAHPKCSPQSLASSSRQGVGGDNKEASAGAETCRWAGSLLGSHVGEIPGPAENLHGSRSRD